MKKTVFFIMVFGCVALGALDAVNDISIIQSILDSNGIKGIAVKDVAEVDSGRVIKLNLRNKDMATDFIKKIPESIGKLSKLRYLSLPETNLRKSHRQSAIW
jgi:hypothetical protein